MATVNKDFKIKSGLIVEGTTASVNGFDILTKKQLDQDYIVGLIGGTATSANTANTVVKRDASGNFAAGTITANLTGQVSTLSNHDTDDLAEGANLYFTGARAVSATAASYDVIGAATAAQSAAATDATTKANAAQSAATSAAASDATSKVAAEAALRVSGDSASVATAATDATTKANAAQAAAEATAASALTAAISTEVSSRNSAISSAISTEVGDRNAAIGTAVAAVVDAAPAALNTLNELAAALANSPDTVSNLTTLVGTKAPLASPALTGVPTAPTAAADTSTTQIATTAFAKAEADAAQSAAEATAAADATAKANAAQSAATSAAASDATTKVAAEAALRVSGDSASVSTAAADATSKANAAQAAAIAHADALVTSDVAESGSLYFTDVRAKQAAAALIVGATKTNITITGDETGLIISAENGVADSTTSNLAEGSNLYFTNARAVTALQNVTPNFTEVELNSVARQVAATSSAPTAGVQMAYSWPKSAYKSAEFLVKVAYGAHTEISKVLLTLDTSDNIAITEYGIVGTNGSASSISAAVSGSNVLLNVTTVNNNSTVTVVGTLLV